MLDFEYTKNHSRLIAIDLRRQKELDADQKAIQKMKLLDNEKMQLRRIYVCFDNFRKSQRNKIKNFWRKCNSIINNGKLLRNENEMINTQSNK